MFRGIVKEGKALPKPGRRENDWLTINRIGGISPSIELSRRYYLTIKLPLSITPGNKNGRFFSR
jgi:hypothetical protein